MKIRCLLNTVVVLYHTKNLELNLESGSAMYSRTATKTCKTNKGNNFRRRHFDTQVNNGHTKLYVQ